MTKYLAPTTSTFRKIVKKKALYIDKTEYIYKLVNQGTDAYFLSRPRRFGKSLFVSTLEELFLGNRELFSGLWIDQSDYEWESYPVIRLDFSLLTSNTAAELRDNIKLYLEHIAQKYNISLRDGTHYAQFMDLILKLSLQHEDEQVIILIDEYDKPIIDNLTDIVEADKIRSVLKEFYAVVKAMDSYIQMVFITGISKFSKVSIFSELNNLIDLTMNSAFATAFGLTETEIRENMGEYITEFAAQEKLSEEALLDRIRHWYDGFRFAADSENVYNPFSTLLLFYHKIFSNYWFESGTPTFLTKLIRERNYDVVKLEGIQMTGVEFGTYEIDTLEIVPVLYQTGYLTIKDSVQSPGEEPMYTLAYPNWEVQNAFTIYLLKEFSTIERSISRGHLRAIVKALHNKDIDKVFDILAVFFANVPYNLQLKREQYYQTIFYVIFKMLGTEIDVEVLTNDGRIDAVAEISDHIFLFEFKLDKDADLALKQIKDHEYYRKYKNHGKPIICIGANFSMETRTVDDWKILEK